MSLDDRARHITRDDFLARGTVVAAGGTQYVSWSQSHFYKLMQEDTEFAYAAQLMISKTLSRKLGKAREEQQQISDYAMMLASEAERAAERREFLATGQGASGPGFSYSRLQ